MKINRIPITLAGTCLFLAAGAFSQAAIVVAGSHSTNYATYVGLISNTDVGDQNSGASISGSAGALGQPATVLTNGQGGASDLLYLTANQGSGSLPPSYTITLDTTTTPGGFFISSIETYAGGYDDKGPQTANQKYTLYFSYVSAPDTFTNIGTYQYVPFSNNSDTGQGSTHMILHDDTGNWLGTGVAKVKIDFEYPGVSTPDSAVAGSVYYEIDVNGVPEPSGATALIALLFAGSLFGRRRR